MKKLYHKLITWLTEVLLQKSCSCNPMLVSPFMHGRMNPHDLGSATLGILSCSTTVASKCTVTAKHTAIVGEETKIEIVSRNSSGEQCYSSNDNISSKFSLVETDCSSAFVWKTVDEKNGKYIISFYSGLLGKVRAQFTINGEPVKQTLLLNIKGRNYTSVNVIHSDFDNR